MSLGTYLPSAQFTLIVLSIALSGGLVYAAQYVTGTPAAPTLSSTPAPTASVDANWQDTLKEIQAQNPSTVSPPDENSVSNLLKAAQSTNLTDTVARTLLINLSDAKAQGLGSDIPTQDKLVAQATAQINQSRTPTYTQKSLAVVDQTSATLKAYGNSVITVLAQHTSANYGDTMVAIGQALQNSDTSKLATLAAIQKDYANLASELLQVPVPQTLAPLHLAVVNNIASIAATYPDMRTLFNDPLRALAALQQYQSLSDETQRLFINIAQALTQRGILFTKDEPGSAWSAFLQP